MWLWASCSSCGFLVSPDVLDEVLCCMAQMPALTTELRDDGIISSLLAYPMTCCSGTGVTSRSLQFTYVISCLHSLILLLAEARKLQHSGEAGFSKQTSARRGGVRELEWRVTPVPAMPSPTGCSPIDFADHGQSWLPCYQQGPSRAPNKVVNWARGLSAEAALSGAARMEDWRGAAA